VDLVVTPTVGVEVTLKMGGLAHSLSEGTVGCPVCCPSLPFVAHWLAGHGALLFFRTPLGRTEEGHLFGNHLHDLMLGAVPVLVLASLHAALNPNKPLCAAAGYAQETSGKADEDGAMRVFLPIIWNRLRLRDLIISVTEGCHPSLLVTAN
jgi:hypothetical protein